MKFYPIPIENSKPEIKTHNYPIPPKTCSEIVATFDSESIMYMFGYTKHDNPRVFYTTAIEEIDYGYCIFVSDAIIEIIEKFIGVENRNYVVDATHKITYIGNFRDLIVVGLDFHGNVSIIMFKNNPIISVYIAFHILS